MLTRGEKISASLKTTNRRKRKAMANGRRSHVRRARGILTDLCDLSAFDVVEVYYVSRSLFDGARSTLLAAHARHVASR